MPASGPKKPNQRMPETKTAIALKKNIYVLPLTANRRNEVRTCFVSPGVEMLLQPLDVVDHHHHPVPLFINRAGGYTCLPRHLDSALALGARASSPTFRLWHVTPTRHELSDRLLMAPTRLSSQAQTSPKQTVTSLQAIPIFVETLTSRLRLARIYRNSGLARLLILLKRPH